VTGEELLSHTWWSLLTARAAESPDRVALHFSGPGWDQPLRFGEWHRLAAEASAALSAAGVGPGDMVAVLCPGSAVWPILQAACSRVGAVLVPLNSRYRLDELSYVLGLTRPKAIFYIAAIRDEPIIDRLTPALPPDTAPALIELAAPRVETTGTRPGTAASADGSTSRPATWAAFLGTGSQASGAATPEVSPADPVLMQFTSGTTAFPKGALLGSASTLRATYELGVRMGLTPDDVMYSTQPMYHVGGSVATTLMALTIGCTMIVPERYSPEETFRLVREHRCTARTGQAAMYAMELAHPDFDPAIFATVTKGWSGGSAELKQAVIERMDIPHLVSMYGLTESSSSTTVCAWHDPLEARLASCGRALPGLEVAILEDGRMRDRDTGLGEICVRGWALMAGYFSDAAATRATIDADGWLHTGDLGRIDDQGYLYFVDRIKEMIKPGGENVSPAEVERVILSFPGVNQVAVVGIPDERLGEVPAAFVERAPGAAIEAAEIIERCAARMARFKVPREVVFVTSWPLTESGKILKRELRDSLARGDLGWVGRSG
jgi:Acyl-CoA synthetases (AMP-forming)/AMP-acid ligases II